METPTRVASPTAKRRRSAATMWSETTRGDREANGARRDAFEELAGMIRSSFSGEMDTRDLADGVIRLLQSH